MKLSLLISAILLVQQSFAHPGQSFEQHAQEVHERGAYLASNKRSLAHCADKFAASGNKIAVHNRRSELIKTLRAKRDVASGMPSHCTTARIEREADDRHR